MGATSGSEGCIVLGPWGGSTGHGFMFIPDVFIEKITIVYGEVIDCIIFCSESTGKTEWSCFGGSGGDKTKTTSLDYPNEFLVSICGTFGLYKDSNVVRSLCFGTNMGCYGPYGTDNGTRFSFDGKDGVIVGFHGITGKYLTAVGIYVMPESLAFARYSRRKDNANLELSSTMSKMAMTMPMPREAGPWGGLGGKPWDDGVFSTIKQVRVHVGESLKVIHAIQFEYVKKDGKSVSSHMHGGTHGDKLELVNIDAKDEFLTGISGFFGPVDGHNGLEAIMSITFHTNKATHGPCGIESGYGFRSFASTGCPGKVVGFHGRNDCFLTAIGVHMEYF